MSRRNTWRKAARRRPARIRTRSATSPIGRSLYRRPLRLEPLEDRRLLAVVTVTTLADTIDFNDGVTSLREAIFATNTVPGADTIEFAPALTAGGPATILLAHGELKITDSLTIDGPGAGLLTIDASGNDPTPNENKGDGSRVFNIDDGRLSTSIDVSMSRLAITGGDVLLHGGGIFSRENLELSQSMVSGNSAQGWGGGVGFAYQNITVHDSTISSNSASRGGGIAGGINFYSGYVPNLRIANSTVSGNDAAVLGGGVYTRFVNVDISRATITENVTQYRADRPSWGGGLWAISANLGTSTQIEHAIIAGNFDRIGNPSDAVIEIGAASPSLVLRSSLIGYSTQSSLVEAPIDCPDADGNLVGGPVHGAIDPMLRPLTDNGGRTPTHALLPGSPAINAGDVNAVAGQDGVPEFDQRGEPFGRIVGGRIDIGTFEYQTPTDLNLLVDTLADESDGDYSRGDLSLREAIELANAADYEGVVDTIRFDPALTEAGPATILLTDGELVITDSLTINGPGADLLTIDASGNDPTPDEDNGDGSRVFNIEFTPANGSTIDVSMSDLRLVGGDVSQQGGGIRCYSAVALSLDRMTIEDNIGGGIFQQGRSLLLSNSQIRANHASTGGGINSVNADVTIRNSTLEANSANRGGGLAFSGFSLSISDSVMVGNTATTRGGAVECISASAAGPQPRTHVEMANCEISENSAGGSGGGIYMQILSGDVLLQDNLLEDNSAHGQGGALWTIITNSNFTLDRNVVRDNSAIRGGGLFVSGLNTSAAVRNTVVEGNSAQGGGGVFSSLNSGLTVTGCAICNNQASDTGGGILGTNLNVKFSLIGRNVAGRAGGGLYLIGNAEINNSTISENAAEVAKTWNFSGGGGIATIGDLGVRHSTITGNVGGGIAGRNATLDNTIVAKNTSQSFLGPFDVAADVTLRNSLLGSSRNANITDLGGSQIGTAEEPIDPLLGPLADNGGFELPDGSHILTHALLASSPAINAGDLNAVAGQGGVPEFDQRGEPFGRIVGGRIDIGAFEYQTPTDLNLLVDTLDDESDGDYSRGDLSLREAIELANAANYAGVVDTIRFDPALTEASSATILLTHGELKITDSLTIDGPGASLLTIDASGNDSTPEEDNGDGTVAFNVDDGGLLTSIPVTISGLNITGGDAAYGGGVLNYEQLTISRCTITGNATKTIGGGVLSLGNHLNLVESTVSGNSAGGSGGGVAAFYGELHVLDSTVANNAARSGAGIHVDEGTALVERSKIVGNIASLSEGFGGGISGLASSLTVRDSLITGNVARMGGGIYSGRYLRLTKCEVSGNEAASDGGGIVARRDTVLEQSTISDNRAGRHGGGVWASEALTVDASTIARNMAGQNGGGVRLETFDGVVRFVQATISSNRSGDQGGGIWISNPARGSVDLMHSTIAANEVTGNGLGGGVFVVQGRVGLNHTIVATNFATVGADLTGLLGASFAARYSLIGENASSGLAEARVGAPDANGNLIGGPEFGPIDPLLGPLQYNGGPTATHALPAPSFYNSPAVDAGDPTAAPGTNGVPQFDQRGMPFVRIVDGDRRAGARIDIGAYESQSVLSVPFLLGDYARNGTVDAADYTKWRDALGSSVTPYTSADGNGDGIVTWADYDVWQGNFGRRSYSFAVGAGGAAVTLATDAIEEPPAEPGATLSRDATALPLAPDRRPPALPGGARRPVRSSAVTLAARQDRLLEARAASRRLPGESSRPHSISVDRAREAGKQAARQGDCEIGSEWQVVDAAFARLGGL